MQHPFKIREGIARGDTEDSRYRCLWLRVIQRAKLDAESIDLMCEDGENPDTLSGDARKWLLANSVDLDMVFKFAGLNRDHIEVLRRGIYGRKDSNYRRTGGQRTDPMPHGSEGGGPNGSVEGVYKDGEDE